MKAPIKKEPLRTKDGRLVGILKGKVLEKEVHASRHLFRKVGKNGAWGIDYEILFTKLPDDGSVHIDDIETRTVYFASVAQWRAMGQVMHFKAGTVDHYTQVFLPLEMFSKTR